MQVLVYGFYSHKNAGDELFIEAFHKLFPNITFTFTDHITSDMLKDNNAVFIGGGSLLDGEPSIENINDLQSKPIFYISVGSETNIHPSHLTLMQSAKLIALRSADKLEFIQTINPNTIVIPDLVYALQTDTQSIPKPNTVLVLPNISVVPQNTDPHWKYTAWEYFKFEFSQVCDEIIDNGYELKFFSMCRDNKLHDDFAAGEIINNMKHREYNLILPQANVFNTISNHSLIITQRYHGIILSELMNRNHIVIHHHDKLSKSFFNTGKYLSYYGFSKSTLMNNFHSLINTNYNKQIPISRDIYSALASKINLILEGLKWQNTQAQKTEELL